MDDEELRKGEEIMPAILKAIGESRISIVLFSEDYASSGWDTMRQIVWPVFCKVDPSEVRRQRRRLKSNGGDLEKVKRWREALTTAANISGWHLVERRESNVIHSIVKSIWAELIRDQLPVPENVVAMDSHVSHMHTLLDMESNEVRMVGICGFGGVGKTTITKATYNFFFFHKFERPTQLQETLISQVTWDDHLKLGNVHRVGGHYWFDCGSRIIITTRDEHFLVAHGVHRYFSSPDYEEFSYSVVLYTKSLPLAIKVLGSFLRGKSSFQWKNTLDELKRVFNGEIFGVLIMSFDILDDYEKDIFLGIACFFKGESISHTREILRASLITIEHGKLEMHDMIQEMGREIVQRESPRETGERSRLWFYNDVLHVLTNGTGTNKVEAIMLKLAALEVHFSACRDLSFFRLGEKEEGLGVFV
ncbi:hypothetical protein EUGRSUZ_C03444 [Eucalyptus grandis]|uniref:Uncharacterized protein n=2 Tax=Eucalyptus grandis TaxID=71139 RepID=A0ACC3LIJ8_EUCGR|nr:hypothetical protein EUGRSUZ_C03444 [Eucalyptus grandis]